MANVPTRIVSMNGQEKQFVINGSNPNHIIYNPKIKIYLVGTSFNLYSYDMYNWKKVDMPSPYLNHVTYGKGIFVGVSQTYNPAVLKWYLDGINWTIQDWPGRAALAGSAATTTGAFYGNGTFIIPLYPNSLKFGTSKNGKEWEILPISFNLSSMRINYVKDKFFITNYSDSKKFFYYSSWWKNWTITPDFQKTYQYGTIHYIDNYYYFLNDTSIYKSLDLTTWTTVTTPTGGGGYWYSIIKTNDIILLFGQSKVYRSIDDGASWAEVTSAIAYRPSLDTLIPPFICDNKFVIISSNKEYLSEDGVTWEEVILPNSTSWSKIITP